MTYDEQIRALTATLKELAEANSFLKSQLEMALAQGNEREESWMRHYAKMEKELEETKKELWGIKLNPSVGEGPNERVWKCPECTRMSVVPGHKYKFVCEALCGYRKAR